MKREIFLDSADGQNRIHVVIWEPEEPVKAVLQISHGMVEYVNRYEEFAKRMSQCGIVVIGNDHLGHGQSAMTAEDLGYFCEKNMSATVVEDLHHVTLYAKEIYPRVPIVLFGHSMGSFLARRYLMTYGSHLQGAILSGTGVQPGAVLLAGKMLANVMKFFLGDRHRSKFLKWLAFGNYNAKIKDARTRNDWLTKVEEIVDRYNEDPYCTFSFTINGYRLLFDTLIFIQKKANIAKLPKDLPMVLISGEEDPVGAYGKGVRQVYEIYQASGVTDIDMKLYPTDRHELVNETDKAAVFQDIQEWINGILPKKSLQ